MAHTPFYRDHPWVLDDYHKEFDKSIPIPSSRKIRLTKSQKQVINALLGIEELPKVRILKDCFRRYKRHDRAIDSLKSMGLIYKDKDNILQLKTITRHNDNAQQDFCNKLMIACANA